MLSLTALVLYGVTLTFWFILFPMNKKTRGNLPPGPWGFPIVGHFPFFGKNPGKLFMKWKKQYGPIFSVRFGSIPAIILNDAKLIRDVFNMEEFSGRPHLHVFVEMTGGKGIGFVDGPGQTEQRKFTLKALKEHSFSTTSVEFRTREEFQKLIDNVKSRIRQKPGQPIEMHPIFQLCVTNVLWDAMMGIKYDKSDKTLAHLVEILEKASDTNHSIIAQLFWFFPWISRLGNFVGYNPPLQAFRPVYAFIRQKLNEMKTFHIQGQPKNFTEAYFDEVVETTDVNSSFHVSKQQQTVSTTDILIAGIDSIAVTMDWLLIYMARETHIQAKLQEEIDTVIGKSDFSLSDRQKMPFLEAVIHEILRISSIAPLGFFHRAIQDVDFHGYHIPEDTMVIANLSGLHHDPEIWEEPDTFNPQRFLDNDGKLNKLTSEVMAFSTGKRHCPAENFARTELPLLITSFFQHFSVSCAGPSLNLECNFGLVTSLRTFKLNVVER